MIEAGQPCREDQLSRAETELGVPLPPLVRRMFGEADGRFRVDGQWWVVWPLDRLVSETRSAWEEGMLDRGLVAFGDDGTGNPFCAAVEASDEVLRWSWIDGEVEQVEGAFSLFLTTWCS